MHTLSHTARAALGAALIFAAGGCLWVPDDGPPSIKFGAKVGVVEVTGAIAESKDVIKQIVAFRDDASVKAVVIRIDSPGGAVGAVQEIYREVIRLRETKKVAASMGTTAASGGYYIAAAADRIFANPGTLTGSIGVIAQIADVGELMELLKVRVATIKAGKYKDTGSPTRPLTDEERALMNDLVAEVHQQFIDDIAKGRRKERAAVEPAADGRVMTGAKAKQLGLVDELGNQQDAVAWAWQAAGQTGKPPVTYGKKKRSPMFRELFDSMLGEFEELKSETAGLKLKYQ